MPEPRVIVSKFVPLTVSLPVAADALMVVPAAATAAVAVPKVRSAAPETVNVVNAAKEAEPSSSISVSVFALVPSEEMAIVPNSAPPAPAISNSETVAPPFRVTFAVEVAPAKEFLNVATIALLEPSISTAAKDWMLVKESATVEFLEITLATPVAATRFITLVSPPTDVSWMFSTPFRTAGVTL